MGDKPDIVLEHLEGLCIKRAYARCGSSMYSEILDLILEFHGGYELAVLVTSLDWEVEGLDISLTNGSQVIGSWGTWS